MHRAIRNHRVSSRVAAILLAAAAPALAADRSWLVADGVWGAAGNWNPLGVPTVADNAFIGNSAGAENATVSMGANGNALNLIISDGMTLRTQLFTPTIGANTSILGFNDVPGPDLFRSQLQVDDGTGAIDFQTNNLTVDDGGGVSLTGGRMRVNGLFDLNTASLFSGTGTLDLHSNAAGPAMLVNGLISPSGGFGLVIHQNGTAPVDLDGTLEGDRIINVTGTSGFSYSSFVLRGTHLNDAFGDTLRIGRGNVINLDLDNGWTLSPSGVVNFQHDPTRPEIATLTGGTMTVQGDITVDADGGGIIQSEAIVQPGALITVGSGGSLTFNQETTINGGEFNIANGADLGFNSPITVSGGTFNAAAPSGQVTFTGFTTYDGGAHFTGITNQIGTATVSTATTITADYFNMDGVGLTEWHVNAPLTMEVDGLEIGGGAFSGTLNINSPNAFSPNYLDMTITGGGGWRLDGTMNLVGPGGGVVHANTVRGSDLHMAGVINATGGHSFTSRVEIETGGTININAGGSVRLDGGTIADPNRMDGGRILGAGTLRSLANHALVGHGTIATSIDFDGNSELRANNGTLRITGAVADVGVIGTAGPTGQLNFTNPWNTGVADRVELLGGLVNGAAITNDGQITGFGSVIAQGISNSGSISAVGGELLINVTGGNPLDLDGTNINAEIRAEQGNLTIVDQPSDNFDAVAYVGPGRTLTLQNGWVVSGAARVHLTGTPGNPAVIAGDGQSFFGSRVFVSGPVRFDIMTLFNNLTDVQTSAAGDSLTLSASAFVDSGATFSGPGELRNTNTGSLVLGEGASVGVRVVNSGPMGVDFTNQTGIASAQRFEQTNTGSMQMQLAGTVPGNDFDRLNVAEDVQLDGALQLGILGGYVPEYLQQHEIVRGDSVSGIFESVPGNMITPTKYWAVTYDADSVTATAALPGDANLDGAVNIADFAILGSNFNTAGPWAEGNFNGDRATDIGDLALLGANFNVSVPANLPRGAGSAVPEPAGLVSALLAVGGLLPRRRR